MSKTAVITGRVPEAISDQLDRLAERMDRSRSWVVSQAIEAFVAAETQLLDSLDEAERQIDGGEFRTQAQMEEWVAELRRGTAA
ncbi:ribbon-helix-helix protein, CopG family [uncultured Sphingomonas sp.]|uniref:CopG family ribbon-helix-helix protein n=1 Tax=uncultured Sphingomonas sp. TaxID=158754 RepID=UPI0025D0231C|nr:ribbon-helix-helix protein, CopG family [uncultured Sphingomonas sp.]